MSDDYDIIETLDRQQAHQRESFRSWLRNTGKIKVLAEYDAKMREIDTGIMGAKATWSALSEAQRRVMEAMGAGRQLHRNPGASQFDALGKPEGIASICGAATVNNLIARELVSWEAGRKIVLTERGRFVLDKGRPVPPDMEE